MTKKDIIAWLAPYEDDQVINIAMTPQYQLKAALPEAKPKKKKK